MADGTKSVVVRQLPATLDEAHARIQQLQTENDALRRKAEARHGALEQPLLGATSLQQKDSGDVCCNCFRSTPVGFFQDKRRRGSTATIAQRRKSDAAGKEPETGITAMGLVAVGFFWVSGGSYGNEALVLAAPPGELLAGLVVLGLSYGIPLALITAELGTGWPVAGGMAQWVEIALGEVFGAHNAWWIWVCYVFDCAIYPVLAAHYLSQYTEVTWLEEKLYAMFIVFVMTLVKLGGRDLLEKMSTVLALLALTPSVIYMASAAKDLDFEYLRSTDDGRCDNVTQAVCAAVNSTTLRPVLPACTWTGTDCSGMNISLYISYIMWLYCGFLSLGSLAGELQHPKSSYVIALCVLVPMVLLVNCMPLMVSMSIDHNRDNFQPGHFEVLATGAVGPWMNIVYFIGSQISLYGLYNSTVVVAECTMPPYLEKYCAWYGFRPDRRGQYRSQCHTFCLKAQGEEEPGKFYVAFNMFCCGLLVWMPYNFLIECTMLLMVLMTYPFLASFVWLRITKPEVPRAFKIPGGTFCAFLCTLPPAAIGTVYLYICIFVEVDHTYGIPYFNVLCCLATIGIGCVAQVIYGNCCSHCREDNPRYSDFGADADADEPPELNSSLNTSRY
jgi:hypothetical protein